MPLDSEFLEMLACPGCKGPLVPTPDETPEPRNRRSLFVLAGQSPSMNAFPRGNCMPIFAVLPHLQMIPAEDSKVNEGTVGIDFAWTLRISLSSGRHNPSSTYSPWGALTFRRYPPTILHTVAGNP